MTSAVLVPVFLAPAFSCAYYERQAKRAELTLYEDPSEETRRRIAIELTSEVLSARAEAKQGLEEHEALRLMSCVDTVTRYVSYVFSTSTSGSRWKFRWISSRASTPPKRPRKRLIPCCRESIPESGTPRPSLSW